MKTYMKCAGKTVPIDPECKSELLEPRFHRARKKAQKLFEKLELEIARGRQPRIVRAFDRICRSFDVKIEVVFEANVRRPLEKRRSLLKCYRIAKTLQGNKLKPFGKVHVKFIEKQSGGHRPISSFGLQHRACQLLVLKLLSLFIKLKDWHYDFRGQQKAALDIRPAMNKGFVHSKRLDAPNFFGTFNKSEILDKLPTPMASIQMANIIGLKSGLFHFHNMISDTPLTLARRGIPQGAICSPYYAAFVLSGLRIEVPEDVRLFVYVDDFFILGKSQEAVERFAKALQSAIADLPGGQFSLVEKGAHAPAEGVVFLGFDFCFSGGKGSIKVAYSSSLKMARIIDKCHPSAIKVKTFTKPTAKQLERMKKDFAKVWLRLRGWQNYFKICDDFEEHNNELESLLSLNAWSVGIKYEELPNLAKRYFGTRRIIRWSSSS